MSRSAFQTGIVSTEGDDLFYKVRGTGIPLLFIAPSGGNGDYYLQVADILSKTYRVITYDRRANGRSSKCCPIGFDIRQQSRDALAVLEAAQEESAYMVGSGCGAVIALDLAAAFPDSVRAAVIHEPILPSILPDSEKWLSFFRSCCEHGKKSGCSAGVNRLNLGIEMPAAKMALAKIRAGRYAVKEKLERKMKMIKSREAADVLLSGELLPTALYSPDYDAIKENGAIVFIGCGKYGQDRGAWYAKSAKILAEKLSCELIIFPGHHYSFMDQPKGWSTTLRKILQKSRIISSRKEGSSSYRLKAHSAL
ncbi:MAG: alpha/beta hydrolase [Clostridiales bacterium]|nr:alpha/beta hydrolase [Clostridiales bacterium]